MDVASLPDDVSGSPDSSYCFSKSWHSSSKHGVYVGQKPRGMEWRAPFCIAPQKRWYDSSTLTLLTDALVSLHWLRVPERIQYKITVLSYRVLHDTAPRYLRPLVSLTYLVDEHSALPAPIAWKYLISNFPTSAAELFRLPPHRSGTHCQTQSFWHQHCGHSSTN